MNLKRYARGPALYIVLALLVLLGLSSGLRGDGGYKKSDTATVLAAIESGDVVSDAKKNKLLDKEQEVRVELDSGKKLQASFLVDQGRDFANAFAKRGVKYDVKVTHDS